MKPVFKIVIVLALAGAVLAAVALKPGRTPAGKNKAAQTATEPTATDTPAAGARLPRLVDLGAGKCVPCKMMAPILVELRKEYAGRMNVEFIDVWENPEAGKPYGIEVIPTQIFFDADGRELFRHVGFFSREDILAKWKELGVELK